MSEYPKKVKPQDVVNQFFAPGLFMLPGGKAVYDEVWMTDGGSACYLARIDVWNDGLRIIRRWIDWDTEILQMFEVED